MNHLSESRSHNLVIVVIEKSEPTLKTEQSGWSVYVVRNQFAVHAHLFVDLYNNQGE